MACHDDGHVHTERKCWNNCRSRAFLTSRVAMLNRGIVQRLCEVASARAAKSLIVCVLYLIRFGRFGSTLRNQTEMDSSRIWL